MSVPEANALSPAPVRIIALIERSALTLLADRSHALVHRERQRVARLRAVEGHVGYAVLDGIEQVFIWLLPARSCMDPRFCVIARSASDEAIQLSTRLMDCFASLAMTTT